MLDARERDADHVLAHCGHGLALERPEALAKMLTEFFVEIRQAPHWTLAPHNAM